MRETDTKITRAKTEQLLNDKKMPILPNDHFCIILQTIYNWSAFGSNYSVSVFLLRENLRDREKVYITKSDTQ